MGNHTIIRQGKNFPQDQNSELRELCHYKRSDIAINPKLIEGYAFCKFSYIANKLFSSPPYYAISWPSSVLVVVMIMMVIRTNHFHSFRAASFSSTLCPFHSAAGAPLSWRCSEEGFPSSRSTRGGWFTEVIKGWING